jgi:uncharacterized lipoprotein NlpE involved in copper resistance
MKKIFISMTAAVMMLCGCGTSGNMNTLGNAVLTDVLTGGQTANGTNAATNTGAAVGNILQSVLGGNNKVTQQNLIGTWKYSQPGCAFTSDKLLAQAGGEVVASEIKGKLQPAYQKAGIKAANTTVTFNADGTFSAKIAGKSLSGNYTFDESTSKITMQGLLLNINCYAKKNTSGIGILFEGKKLLTLMQTLATLSGNQTAQTIGDLSKNYDGLRIGFDMK